MTAMSRTIGRRKRRVSRPSAIVWICMVFLALFVLTALLAPLVLPADAAAQNLATGLTGPSSHHLLGTDDLGRDILAMVLLGARSALIGPLIVALGAGALGGALGVLAGFRGGWTDTVIMRWVDLMYALPGLLVLIVVAGVAGGGYGLAVIMLLLFNAPYVTRIVRGATLEQRSRAYVEAARVLGVSRTRRMAVHILPNVLPELVAATFLQYATALLALSSLSFLGLGAPPGSSDWGLMAASNRTFLFDNPASMLAPAGLIILAAATMNIVGDWAFEQLERRGRTR